MFMFDNLIYFYAALSIWNLTGLSFNFIFTFKPFPYQLCIFEQVHVIILTTQVSEENKTILLITTTKNECIFIKIINMHVDVLLYWKNQS